VVFSKKYGNFIENDVTGERIVVERVGNTFEMKLKAEKMDGSVRKKLKWSEMEVAANEEIEEDEKMADEVEKALSGETVFRRRTQS